jgi:hypothetical protein
MVDNDLIGCKRAINVLKSPEFWYVLVLAVTVVAYGVGCFYYFNHSAEQRATLYFAYAVYAALVARFLATRLGQNPAGAFARKSLLLFGAGLLPLLLLGLGVGSH